MPLLAPGLGPLGFPELIILLVIVVLIFGVGRLPEVGGAIGKSIREFRKSTTEDDDSPPAADQAAPAASGSDVAFCTECGAGNARNAKFCAGCGHALEAKVG